MKIKITLIAFFASVLVLTSCMKNEVSPGIEQVRAAYAALLNAKAQAETTMAAANAVYRNAEAQVQLSLAAINLALADSNQALADSLQADLAYKMDKWAQEILDLELQYQKDLDEYAALVAQTANELVEEYFGDYMDAIGVLRRIQNAIFEKEAEIRELKLDLENGTVNYMDEKLADLADAEAFLAELQAMWAMVQEYWGMAEVQAKIDELSAQKKATALDILTKTAQAAEMEPDFADEQEAYDKAYSAYSKANSTYKKAQTALANAATTFEEDNPVPDFWRTAQDSVENALDSLEGVYADTLAACGAYRDALDTLALGTSDIDDEIAALEDSIGLYEDTVDMYVADTLAAFEAWEDAVGAYDDLVLDTVDWYEKLIEDTEALAELRLTPDEASPLDTLLQVLTLAADSNLMEAYLEVARLEGGTLDILDGEADDALGDYEDALEDYNDDVMGAGGYDEMLTDMDGRLGDWEDALEAREDRLEWLDYWLDDLETECLHMQSYIEEVIAFWEDAVAYKESRRPDYEEYMDAFWYDYLAELEQDVQDAKDIKDAKEDLMDAAEDLLDAAQEDWLALLDEIDDLQKLKDNLDTYIGLWRAVKDKQEDFAYRSEWQTALNNAAQAVVDAEQAVADAEEAYEDNMIDYAKYMQDMTNLNARLVAAQAQVDFWKALLDEAIANAN